MYRFVLALALALIFPLCSFINAQSQVPSPDPVEVNDRKSDVESEPLAFAASDDPAVSFAGVESDNNNFFGFGAGASITTGERNSFFGGYAGHANAGGWLNSFFGCDAGLANDGHYNAFFGAASGYSNTVGSWNSFFGCRAGEYTTTAWDNSFFGSEAGHSNTTGIRNCSFGSNSGHANSTGGDNCFLGVDSGSRNTIESRNTFLGTLADLSPDVTQGAVTNATAVGFRACVSQANSLVLGSIAGMNDATSYVNVGIGTPAPVRQLHLAGPNAVFRMDRSTDTAAFIMVRTDTSGNPMKTFIVGTNASGVNQGEFIINDVGTAVGGLGNRRMTITNEGNVQFTGTVSAVAFSQTSSIAFKANVRTYENALETVNRLRGVRFDWKDTGKPAVGLIAEEVEQVLPEVVAHEDGKASGVNYANLVAVLVEAVKEQQARIERLERLLEQRQP